MGSPVGLQSSCAGGNTKNSIDGLCSPDKTIRGVRMKRKGPVHLNTGPQVELLFERLRESLGVSASPKEGGHWAL